MHVLTMKLFLTSSYINAQYLSVYLEHLQVRYNMDSETIQGDIVRIFQENYFYGQKPIH